MLAHNALYYSRLLAVIGRKKTERDDHETINVCTSGVGHLYGGLHIKSPLRSRILESRRRVRAKLRGRGRWNMAQVIELSAT